MPEKVRCADCGLLSIRNIETWSLDETDDQFRCTGEVNFAARGKFLQAPICFAMQFNLGEEYGTIATEGTIKAEGRLGVITSERECPSFHKWQQGFTPKEHIEMRMLEEQRDWQRRQAKRERKWRKEDVAPAKQSLRLSIRAYLIAATIGFVGALAAVALARLLNS